MFGRSLGSAGPGYSQDTLIGTNSEELIEVAKMPDSSLKARPAVETEVRRSVYEGNGPCGCSAHD